MATKEPSPSIAQLLDLGGRVAVVTGAAKGIGAAVANRLHEAGAKLALFDIDQSGLRETTAQLESAGANVHAASVDVTDPKAFAAACQGAVDKFGKVDILVNNAGISPRSRILDITDEQWDAVVDLNLKGAFLAARWVGRHMVKTRSGGVIVNIASSTAYRVSANPAHYRVSKAGLVALTQSLAVELGRHGIRVLAIAPTLVETPAVRALRNQGLSEGLDEFVRRLPLKRIGKPDDVARAVLFAVSDMASFMTGSTIFVDGGETCK
jgi:NAD(P)-dependent dehydrogenase (short-subunit alcohol dehydrogenase family)